eukprot:NODE_8483_length_1492_cov_6.654212.p1 GENE.NODE_8483_length_1492_cov_6.654212~~NODE_8483_length_1492_cov_6.654212.p1  ORF type:complete len:257 (+),score=37.61 NODE_8483_length_1492_cov_6.654212:626-1396(+)
MATAKPPQPFFFAVSADLAWRFRPSCARALDDTPICDLPIQRSSFDKGALGRLRSLPICRGAHDRRWIISGTGPRSKEVRLASMAGMRAGLEEVWRGNGNPRDCHSRCCLRYNTAPAQPAASAHVAMSIEASQQSVNPARHGIAQLAPAMAQASKGAALPLMSARAASVAAAARGSCWPKPTTGWVQVASLAGQGLLLPASAVRPPRCGGALSALRSAEAWQVAAPKAAMGADSIANVVAAQVGHCHKDRGATCGQ